MSNLVLDDLDQELTRRGHRFCRYADDCNIYVRSRRAGERVMASVCRFLTTKLRLKVNESKERGGSAGGAEVPGLQHRERRERTAHRAEGTRKVPDAEGPNGLEPLSGWVSAFRSDCGIKRIAALAHAKVPSSS